MIGAVFLTHAIELEDCQVKFDIWDTAGQERYRALAPMYYKGAKAALIVYDITSSVRMGIEMAEILWLLGKRGFDFILLQRRNKKKDER